ncbi:hypothetical protein [Saccharopolyspora sp. NPDC002376]
MSPHRVGSPLASSAVAQLLGYGRPARTLELIGLPLLATGLVLLAAAGELRSLALLLIATVIAGMDRGWRSSADSPRSTRPHPPIATPTCCRASTPSSTSASDCP